MDATYPLIFDGPAIAVGSLSSLVFRSFAGLIPDLAHSFPSCQLPVKGRALGTPKKSVVRIN